MERLAMRQIQDVIFRLSKGESVRSVARALGHHRATISRYRQIAEEKGYLAPGAELPDAKTLLEELGDPAPPPVSVSSVDPFAKLVEEWHEQSVEMRAMHRMLREDHGFSGSYSAVRRYVAARHPRKPEAFVRIECAPGEEAQVDFGHIGKLKDPVTAELRTAYCFVMTLSFSRHMYVEFVFEQTIATFVGCHVRAFRYLGGVVQRVVIDNLKAAVLRADIESPLLSTPYRQLGQHMGFLIHPCRPRTPEHKGKVESGIHYVERNLVPSLGGKDRLEANACALRWVEQYAGVRDHGTTRKQPLVQFETLEKPALAALPEQPFELETVVEAKVHRDCHVILQGSYYSAPQEYVGKQVEAHVFQSTVQLYDGVTLLRTHERSRVKGERITAVEDYPQHKARYLERTPEFCNERAKEVGPSCLELVEALLGEKPIDKRRAAVSLIALLDRYPKERVEAACRRAIAVGDPRYQRVKQILCADQDSLPPVEEQDATERAAFVRYRYARAPAEFFGGGTHGLKEGAAC